MLVDYEIAALCGGGMIAPFEPGQIKAGNIGYGLSCVGYDCRLGYEIKWLAGGVLDPKRPSAAEWVTQTYSAGAAIQLGPGDFVLANTIEHFALPRTVAATFVGKSTLARCGVLVLATPAEPSWRGYLTLEICNPTHRPLVLYAGEGIGQMLFHQVAEPAVPYDAPGRQSSYQDQEARPVAARHQV